MPLKLLPLFVIAFVIGCSGDKPPAPPTLDESAAQKLEAMKKIAAAVSAPNAEFAVRHALEKFRKVPFQVKAQVDTSKEILKIYAEQVQPKLGGEIAAEVAGEMDIIAEQLK